MEGYSSLMSFVIFSIKFPITSCKFYFNKLSKRLLTNFYSQYLKYTLYFYANSKQTIIIDKNNQFDNAETLSARRPQIEFFKIIGDVKLDSHHT